MTPVLAEVLEARGGAARWPITASRRDGRRLISRDAGKRGTATPRPAGRGLDERQLQVVNRTIDENLAEDVSVSMLSSIAGLSRSHFSQAFRRSVGRTPHEHVVRMRIDRAMKLMLEGDAPLSEIALATGFCDQAHFANTFRRALGMTPKTWRKARRAGQAA